MVLNNKETLKKVIGVGNGYGVTIPYTIRKIWKWTAEKDKLGILGVVEIIPQVDRDTNIPYLQFRYLYNQQLPELIANSDTTYKIQRNYRVSISSFLLDFIGASFGDYLRFEVEPKLSGEICAYVYKHTEPLSWSKRKYKKKGKKYQTIKKSTWW